MHFRSYHRIRRIRVSVDYHLESSHDWLLSGVFVGNIQRQIRVWLIHAGCLVEAVIENR